MSKREINGAIKSYYRSLTKVLLTPEEEVRYASIIQSGNSENPSEEMENAVNKLWEHNLRLVIKIVMVMYNNGELGDLDNDDAIAYGRLGLKRAAWLFNPEKYSNKFSTYARHWIYKEIRDAVNTKGSCSGYVNIPPSAAGKAKRLAAARWKYMSEHGRYPTKKELCDLTGVNEGSIDNLIRVGEWKRMQVSFMKDEECCHDSDFRKMQNDDEIKHMRRAMSKLTPLEAKIIVLRRGLDGNGERKLDDVGDVVSKSGERVRQIQNKAMKKLLRYMSEPVDDHDEIDYGMIIGEEAQCQGE